MTQIDYIVLRITKECEVNGIESGRKKYILFFKNKNFCDFKEEVDKQLIDKGYEHLIDKTI